MYPYDNPTPRNIISLPKYNTTKNLFDRYIRMGSFSGFFGRYIHTLVISCYNSCTNNDHHFPWNVACSDDNIFRRFEQSIISTLGRPLRFTVIVFPCSKNFVFHELINVRLRVNVGLGFENFCIEAFVPFTKGML